ncbi:MAG: ATP-binding protein, partial [Gammaproteobacteria bacterium]|nr:ATP-binding protein [Gammaproteobacteria bacterium]
MEAITGFTGRADEIARAEQALLEGRNVLIRGRAGMGKSCALRQVFERIRAQPGRYREPIWLEPGSTKAVLTQLAVQLHEIVGLAMPKALLGPRLTARAQREGLAWRHIARTFARLNTAEAVPILLQALDRRPCLIFIDSLEVPPSLAEVYAELFDHCRIAAGMDADNRRSRINRLLWRFPLQIDLRPLPLADCSQLAEAWLARHPLRFSDERTRQRFIRHIAQDSGGVPAAIRGMLEAAAAEDEITPAKAFAFEHEAGIRYLDMTPLVILLIVVFMAARYISRGFGLEEMLVWSGVATALFTGVRFFMYQMR